MNESANAEILYYTLQSVMARRGLPLIFAVPFYQLDAANREAWVAGIVEFDLCRIQEAASPTIDWKTLLEMYGRHKPTCDACGPCSCGFAAIEALLAGGSRDTIKS